MVNKMKIFRKANVILEYGIVLFIVVGFMAGVNTYIQRALNSSLKGQTDRIMGKGVPGYSLSFTTSTAGSTLDKVEGGGSYGVSDKYNGFSVTFTPPAPPYINEHKGSSLHAQDAASKPPEPDYPDLEYDGWDDQGWQLNQPI